MSITIIVKGKKERYFAVPPRSPSLDARRKVSRENRTEYDNEKRAKEISAKMRDSHPDYNAPAVAKMMGISEGQAKKMIHSKSKAVVLDGKID